jgi:N-dimethylarginine dimethylaminohydrolase
MKKNLSRRTALKAIGLTIGGAAIGTEVFPNVMAKVQEESSASSLVSPGTDNDPKRIIEAWNEWGKLREAVLGNVEGIVEPSYIDALVWVSEEGKKALRETGGLRTSEAFPEEAKKMNITLNRLEKVLTDQGVIVHRTKPIPEDYKEETSYLKDVQKGSYTLGGADFFRVLGTNVILLNSFHMPFRRSNIWTIRRVLEPLLEGTDNPYFATPPPSPHYTRDDLFIENGDMMVDGHNVYVGMSGNATSPKGVAWLKQLLGNEYRVHVIRLKPDLFHLDWLLTLNRPGLMTYCPEALLDPLPEPLTKWDKIETHLDETAGANNLSIDEKTIVVPEHLTRICDAYDKKGMKVITIPAVETIMYGSGPRCLTAVLRRDP